MKKYSLVILFSFCVIKSFSQTANAGADQTIYLTKTSTAILNGSGSSGRSYQWTDITNTIQNPLLAGTAFNGFPVNTGNITSPKSAKTTVTGLSQGVWYYQIAVTTGASTKYDSVAIIVDYDTPPARSSFYRGFPIDSVASVLNLRNDTSVQSPTVSWWGGYNINFDQGRSPDMYSDTMRRKFYSTIEDGWPITYFNFPMAESAYNSSQVPIDTTTNYLVEWKGYFPQSDSLMTPGDASTALVIWELHGNDEYSPPFSFVLRNNTIWFYEIVAPGNDQVVRHAIAPYSNFYNKTNTFRIQFKEGIGNGAYIKVFLNGNQVYLRDTGTVGRTFLHDYMKFNAVYDYDNNLVSSDTTMRGRGRKFSLVTESYKVYTMPNSALATHSVSN